jgi:hypothetical protein
MSAFSPAAGTAQMKSKTRIASVDRDVASHLGYGKEVATSQHRPVYAELMMDF